MKKITIAVVGLGTVGGGVVEMLTNEKARLKRLGVDIRIKTVCALIKPKPSELVLPKGTTFTKDVADVYKDTEIDLVVELISNVKVGGEVVLNSLKAGKHVVSANKAALDNTYPKIAAILAKNSELCVGIEAAVAGGIPVIGTVSNHTAADPVVRIAGILNGTTNFIITKMEKEGLAYDEVLKEAQALGYAEADPRADVEGYDARSKLSLLMQLIYGVHPHKDIRTTGISKISSIDFKYAHMLKATIRSVGLGERIKNSVSGFVAPCIVKNDSNFAAIRGATNAVSIDSKYLQNTFLVGQGAGRYPTAASVVADIIRIAKGSGYSIAPKETKVTEFTDVFKSEFYVRLQVKDQLGIVEKVGALCKKHKISIDAVLQLPVESSDSLPFVITTDECSSVAINSLVNDLQKLAFVNEEPFVMPILNLN